jgi:hypothetical protein
LERGAGWLASWGHFPNAPYLAAWVVFLLFLLFLLRIAYLDETADTVTEKEQYCGGLEQGLTH